MQLTDVIVADFADAFDRGLVCLHPTDTIPGLTFRADICVGAEIAQRIKARAANKPFIHLAPNVDVALAALAEVSPAWAAVLRQVWPAPLSVVAQMAQTDNGARAAEDGTIAVRVPALPAEAMWLQQFMAARSCLIPSTSVNLSGIAPAVTWNDAAALLRQMAAPGEVHVPMRGSDGARQGASSTRLTASTIIRIVGETSFAVVRPGAFATEILEKNFGMHPRERQAEEAQPL